MCPFFLSVLVLSVNVDSSGGAWHKKQASPSCCHRSSCSVNITAIAMPATVCCNFQMTMLFSLSLSLFSGSCHRLCGGSSDRCWLLMLHFDCRFIIILLRWNCVWLCDQRICRIEADGRKHGGGDATIEREEWSRSDDEDKPFWAVHVQRRCPGMAHCSCYDTNQDRNDTHWFLSCFQWALLHRAWWGVATAQATWCFHGMSRPVCLSVVCPFVFSSMSFHFLHWHWCVGCDNNQILKCTHSMMTSPFVTDDRQVCVIDNHNQIFGDATILTQPGVFWGHHAIKRNGVKGP